ncbi:MAG: DJ-1/PfpI family protein [Prochloraceae cyanobacterium]|nr:DJ-1/PfpI family protein [Prochloraceae cyanobacterium]
MSSTNGARKKRVAILIENNFEDFSVQIPRTALEKAGAKVTLLGSRMNDEYKSKRGQISFKPQATASEMRAEDFDALIIPCGEAPDHIRANPFAVSLVTEALSQNLLVGAIGRGLQVIVETKQLQGKQVTGKHSISSDLKNAGAIYKNEPVVVDGNLISARQPADLPIFTTELLNRLKLNIEGTTLPEVQDRHFEWWKLGEGWGGSTRKEIVKALNTAIMGERYTLEAFRQYSYRVKDEEFRQLLQEITAGKEGHVKLLEARLKDGFNEQISWQAVGSEAYAILQSLLQSEEELSIWRRAIGDIQTGVVDTYHLCGRLTDLLTVTILEKIERDLADYEQRLTDLYRKSSGDKVQPPMPSTFAAVS